MNPSHGARRLPKVTRRAVLRWPPAHPWRVAGYTTLTGASAALTAALPSPLPPVAATIVGAVCGVSLCASHAMYQRLRRALGRATALAAVCLAWSSMWTMLVLSSDSCLTPGRQARCTGPEVATYSLVGLLMPLVVPAFTLGPWLTYRAARRLITAVRSGAPLTPRLFRR